MGDIQAMFGGFTRIFHTEAIRSGLDGHFRPVLQNLDFLDSHQTARHHVIQHGKEFVVLLRSFDDLNNDWQILSKKTQDFRGVDVRRMAKPDMSTQVGSACKVHAVSSHCKPDCSVMSLIGP